MASAAAPLPFFRVAQYGARMTARRLATLAAAALLAALSLSACAGAKPAPDCRVEFLFTQPTRPYERLEVFDEMVRTVPPGGAHLALRGRACAMGADAVVITKSMVVNLLDHTNVQGYAIKWTPPEAAPAAPATEPAAPAKAPEAPAQPAEPAESKKPETLKL